MMLNSALSQSHTSRLSDYIQVLQVGSNNCSRDAKDYIINNNLVVEDPWLRDQRELAASGVCQM